MNVIIQTGPLRTDILRQIPIAGADLVKLVDQADRILDCSGTGIGTKIDGFIFF